MEPNWGNYWAGARKMGWVTFVLKRGTMLGLVMFILLVGLPRLFDMVEANGWPVVQFVGFLGLGYCFAGLLWWANERSYHKLNENKNETTKEVEDTKDE